MEKNKIRNYNELTQYIFTLRKFGRKKGLENMKHLLNLIGNPEKSFKTILVTGSSGKGSTAKFIASILQKAGYKVGLYVKPHLIDYTERISINGGKISKKDTARMLNLFLPIMKGMKDGKHYYPTFFETTVALAVNYFKEKKVDYAVLEIGLGGRYDACNAVDPVVSVITNINLVHTDILGNTINKIAKDKAGIIRRNGILVTSASGEALEVFKKICTEKNARIYSVRDKIRLVNLETSDSNLRVNINSNNKAALRRHNIRRAEESLILSEPIRYSDFEQSFDLCGINKNYKNLKIKMFGDYQILNAASAVYTADLLDISEKEIRNGLSSSFFPGRFHIIRKKPNIIIDCAKDPDALLKLRWNIESKLNYRKIISVFAISDGGKDIDSMIEAISSLSSIVISTSHKVNDRSISPFAIKRKIGKKCIVVPDSSRAIQKALKLADKNDLILITGSVYLAGEALKYFNAKV